MSERQLNEPHPCRFHGAPLTYMPVATRGTPAGWYSYVVLPQPDRRANGEKSR